jgi:hypothetical protein
MIRPSDSLESFSSRALRQKDMANAWKFFFFLSSILVSDLLHGRARSKRDADAARTRTLAA